MFTSKKRASTNKVLIIVGAVALTLGLLSILMAAILGASGVPPPDNILVNWGLMTLWCVFPSLGLAFILVGMVRRMQDRKGRIKPQTEIKLTQTPAVPGLQTMNIRAVYMWVVAPIPISNDTRDQLLAEVIAQKNKTNRTFQELHGQAERQNLPLKKNHGILLSTDPSHIANSFIEWLRVECGLSRDTIAPETDKDVFIFNGDARNPKDDKPFMFSAFIYFHH